MVISSLIDNEDMFQLTSRKFMMDFISNRKEMSREISELRKYNPATLDKLERLYQIKFDKEDAM